MFSLKNTGLKTDISQEHHKDLESCKKKIKLGEKELVPICTRFQQQAKMQHFLMT